MTNLTPRNVFRQTTTCHCGTAYYSNTAWDHGQLVLLDGECSDCAGQGALFGGGE